MCVICGGKATVEAGGVDLCATHAESPRTYCARCQRLVRVDTHNIVRIAPYPDPANAVFTLCATCIPRVDFHCRACGFPAAYRDGGQVLGISDASGITPPDQPNNFIGWRCAICSVGALQNKAAAQGAYNAAEAWLTNWVQGCGQNYPAYGARLEWSVDRDATFPMGGNGMELGNCVTTTYGGGQPPTHRIRVLYFMRPLSFQQTMLHELTHALTNELGIGNKPLIEGFCNYVAYLYLLHISQTGASPADRAEASRAIARMEANQDQHYGVGFRTVRQNLANIPAQALTWLAST